MKVLAETLGLSEMQARRSLMGLVDKFAGNNLQPGNGQAAGGGIVQETVVLNGTIIGEGQRVECEVRVTKTTLVGYPAVFSDYRILESDITDRLPDGNYDLLVNHERARFSRDAGRFLSHPY